MENLKEKWNPNETHTWNEFNKEQLNKTSLSSFTKQFLSDGFPSAAAPSLSFNFEIYNSEYKTIAAYYSEHQLNPKTNNYWIFGSDGSGNPICIDANSNDKILLLDHEQGFDPIQSINKNIVELAHCILEYKNFIELINSEFGENGFFDSKFTKTHLIALKKRFELIDINIFRESDFWNGEIEMLFEEIEEKSFD